MGIVPDVPQVEDLFLVEKIEVGFESRVGLASSKTGLANVSGER